MLLPTSLRPAVQRTAAVLVDEFLRLHPERASLASGIPVLVEAVTAHLARAVTWRGGWVLKLHEDEGGLSLVLERHGVRQALCVHDVVCALLYTDPRGRDVHPSLEELVLNRDTVTAVFVRLAPHHPWGAQLHALLARCAAAVGLVRDEGLSVPGAHERVQYEAHEASALKVPAFLGTSDRSGGAAHRA